MKFEVYCDENQQDVLTSKSKKCNQYLMIGSLWIPADLRHEIKDKISAIKIGHKKYGEIKWSKVSTSGLSFYKDLIDLYISYKEEMRFRCIAVRAKDINWHLHDHDRELGFYKFYYQLLLHWISGFNEYEIFCDWKTNKHKDELKVLKRVLNYADLSSDVLNVQALPSKEVVLIQLSDLLLGAASSRINNTISPDGSKEQLVRYLEEKLGVQRLGPTNRDEQKFNIFKMNLKGGW